MASPINIGVDFGSLGWRAAYVTGQQTVVVPSDEQDQLLERRLWQEPSQSPIGISFPSFKSKLSTGARLVMNGDARSAEELATQDLIALSQRITGETSQTIGQAVISVPANYSASRRAALREAALKAGFAEVQLLNDSMAAVINFASQNEQSATLLVYGMGYAGFEIGLVRSAHGRYRTLGYESGQAPAGAGWDELFLTAWWSYFARQNLTLVPAPNEWTSTQWLQVRLTAQQVKEALSLNDQANFPMLARKANSTEPFLGQVSRTDWETTIAPSINATLGLAERLLAESNLTVSDVDAILLTGGSTRVPLVSRLINKRFGKKPIALEVDAIAKGAAVYASRLETAPAPAGVLGDAIESSADTVDISKAELPISTSITTERASRQSSNKSWLRAVPMREQMAQSDSAHKNVEAARDLLLAYIHHLIRQGQARQAKLFIQKFGQDAHALFENVSSITRPATHEDINPLKQQKAERAISQAYQSLNEHKEEEAVVNSHVAWQTMPDSPDIFDQMIDIHCRAAMAKIEIESYTQSCKWLECALSHDQSNSRTRAALADRHYLHAKQMADRGKRKEAQLAIEHCLHWNPEHGKGVELRAKL